MYAEGVVRGVGGDRLLVRRVGRDRRSVANENTNGLLRQYFPKGSNLSVHGPEALRAVEHLLNTRPRKVLGWKTPAEVFNASVTP
jgi:IS30 family transposase